MVEQTQMTKTFTAFIRDGVHDKEQLESDIRKFFEGKNVDITYQLHRKKRSLAQNRAMFGIPFKMIADAMTEAVKETTRKIFTVEDVNDWIKQDPRFNYIFEKHSIEEIYQVMPNGDTVRLPNTTRRLTTLGESLLYKELQLFGAETLYIDIPDPNEKDFKDENKK